MEITDLNHLEDRVSEVFESIKQSHPSANRIPVEGTEGFYLEPVCKGSDFKTLVPLLSKWRRENISGFTKIFNVTDKSTMTWVEKGLLDRKDRILFIVTDGFGRKYGHVGLSSFDYQQQNCEIDNIVRGESGAKGLFYFSCKSLINWVKMSFPGVNVELRVLNDNSGALALYYRLGFCPVELIPLEKVESVKEVEWLPISLESSNKIDRFFIRMSFLG